MNLGELKSLTHHATKNDVILGVFPALINEALKEVQRLRSFRCNKKTIDLTITAGNSSVALPSNFKEPQRGKNPLTATDNSAEGFTLWFLHSKQEVERLAQIGCGTAVQRAYIDDNDGVYSLHTFGPMDINTVFHLDAMVFLPALSADSDTNYLLTEYPMMVLEKTKALAFALDEDNPEVTRKIESCNKRYAEFFTKASADDASRQNAGRVFRMGGV